MNFNLIEMNIFALSNEYPPENRKSSPPPLEGQGEVHDAGNPGYITANPYTYKFISEYRRIQKEDPTQAEKVIWTFLKSKKTGHKIRRQHIIDIFITDFVCLTKKVVIEIDGKIHEFHKKYDELRTLRLNELGYEVIRFKNEDVLCCPEKIATKIKDYLDQKTNPTPALQRRKSDDNPKINPRNES
jgi:very-short-patch-repair endonuclease